MDRGRGAFRRLGDQHPLILMPMSFLTPYVNKISIIRGGALRANPERDWAALLGMAAIAFAGIFMWNISVFETVVSGGALRKVEIPPPPVVDTASLEAIQALFAERAAEEAKYVEGAYLFVDPSQQP